MNHSYIEDAKVFKAFCDENRLMILEMLRSGEKCACKLLENLNIGQSTLSHHMKILCDSGVVRSRAEGKWTHYSLNDDGIGYAKTLLNELTAVNTVSTADSCDCCKL
jgi:ArsR family transcriptional regulator, arsenate/arsenite/antimonite-responsive transcriptional repressor